MRERHPVWPAIGWARGHWQPGHDPSTSQRQRILNRDPFAYAVVPHIADEPVALDAAAQEAARAATAAIERFDERATGWGTPFASILLRSESASSSRIENLTASARRVALATLGNRSHPNATLIAQNVAAMEAAIALADSMDTPAILAMHAALGGGDDPDRAGRLRDQWVWIRGNSPVTADYVAPHHDTLPAAIDDLTRFARRVDIEPLTQAALAHAQFETIHPFTDGNGRTGRALVSSILRHRGVATNLTVPISSGLLVDTQAYFDALTAYREGDPHPIVDQFATAADRAIANASQLRDDVDEVADQIRATAQRRTANLEALAGLCAAEPAFTIDMAVARGIPAPSAYRLCARLTDAGLLRRERSLPNRADVWTVPALTDALDAFARRAGRRNFQ